MCRRRARARTPLLAARYSKMRCPGARVRSGQKYTALATCSCILTWSGTRTDAMASNSERSSMSPGMFLSTARHCSSDASHRHGARSCRSPIAVRNMNTSPSSRYESQTLDESSSGSTLAKRVYIHSVRYMSGTSPSSSKWHCSAGRCTSNRASNSLKCRCSALWSILKRARKKCWFSKLARHTKAVWQSAQYRSSMPAR
mmetsp:Transcript_14698/g.50511  ORF Transcript_14698/g.50511 Transcript_14698/m.50511 type:complete len:200 (+) Transcript_14698:31-630(+)